MEEVDPEISAMVYLDWQYHKKWGPTMYNVCL